MDSLSTRNHVSCFVMLLPSSDVNEATRCKAKALGDKAKDLSFNAKANNFGLKAKAKHTCLHHS